MSSRMAWPSERNPIVKVNYELMTGFSDKGQPKYASGEITSAEEREVVQAILEPLIPVSHTIASVTMGKVKIELEDGNEITLRPVFHPSQDTYRDLFFVDEWQFPMPKQLAELLERWRKIKQS